MKTMLVAAVPLTFLASCSADPRGDALHLRQADSSLAYSVQIPGGQYYDEPFVWTLTAMGEPWFVGAHVDGEAWVIDRLDRGALRIIGRWDHDSLYGAPVYRAGNAIRRAAGLPDIEP